MTAYDEGFDLFKREPELLLIEVFWRGAYWTDNGDRQEFVDGYRAARRQHDEFKTEKGRS